MSSKKEEDRNEKIIRGLMKLPPNRRCINCNSLGPQYVCTNFWTFVCIACSGIHREFTHRVKSVSMAKFTKQEVEALQRGGNQHAREMFLKDWDAQQMRLPNSSNPDKIRAFIKDVYVNKKYAGGRFSDKPLRDLQSLKNHEEEQRRPNSYNSFSQNPSYENQYEDRRYGKQMGRRPGSDQGLYDGKISSIVYSQGRLREQMHEDRFANESSGSRASDYSVSSTGDPFRFDGQSPNFQDTGYNSPPLHQVRDILVEDAQPQIFYRYPEVNVKRDLDGFPHPQRTASSSSFGSFDSNSVSLKSVNSGSIVDVVLEPEHSIGTKQTVASTFPSLSQSSASVQSRNQDLFNLPFVQPPMTSSVPSLDLFADISNHPSSTTPPEQRLSTVPFPENEGWATFDLHHHVRPASETNKGVSAMVPPVDVAPKGTEDALTSMHNNSQWFSVQSSVARGPFLSSTGRLNVGLQEDRTPADHQNSQSWNAFDDSNGNTPHTSFGCGPYNIEPHILIQKSQTSVDQYVGLEAPEGPFINGLQKSTVDDTISGPSLPFNATGLSFPPSVLPLAVGATQAQKSTNPFDLPYDSDSEANNELLDISSLQAALPNQQLPTAHIGGLTQPWFHQNSVSTFVPSLPQGGLAYIARQAPSSQLPNLPPQGPVASRGGNPFV